MSSVARTNVKTSTRYNDAMTVNDWLINFDYEVVSGVLSERITAIATKDSASMHISKANNNISVSLSNTSYDIEVVGTILTEITSIQETTY